MPKRIALLEEVQLTTHNQFSKLSHHLSYYLPQLFRHHARRADFTQGSDFTPGESHGTGTAARATHKWYLIGNATTNQGPEVRSGNHGP
jgi:hypothetical protein